MKKIIKGVALGAVAGAIDVIPMIFQKLTWDANISAFIMWVVVGFFLSITNIKIAGFLKGIFFSFLILLPTAVIIGWKEPFSLVPIGIMTLILGALLGIATEKIK